MNDYPTTANGQYEFGGNLPNRRIVMDEAKATYYSNKAIEQGHAEVLYELGNYYNVGKEGVRKDKKKATFLYTEAVKQYIKDKDRGSADAMMGLAQCYSMGKGIGKDMRQSDYWYGNAAEQYARDAERGSAHALFWLSVLYSSGGGYGFRVPGDINKAQECILKAAELGSLAAQVRLGEQYRQSNGYLNFPQDINKAVYWYTKAAEQNRSESGYGYYASSADAQTALNQLNKGKSSA